MKKSAPVSPVYLVVDARETAVIPFLEAELKTHRHQVRQINTGDYLVCRRRPDGQAAVLACIERKTLTDFAASFRDARYENKQKMLELRAKTGCQLYFLVEGPAFPSLDRHFSRIPYSSILAAITNLMVRDGMFIMQTSDQKHTAERLHDLLRAFDSLQGGAGPRRPADAAPLPSLAGTEDGERRQQRDTAEAPQELAPTAAGEEPPQMPPEVPEELTRRRLQPDDTAALSMWSRLRGVSVVLAKVLARTFSVADLVGQKVPDEAIRAMRTVTGHPINKDAVRSLLGVRAGDSRLCAKLLSGLQNVTPAVAEIILTSTGGMARLCSYAVPGIALITLPQKNRNAKLGEVRAERIHRMLRYKEGLAPSLAEPAGPPLSDKDLAEVLGF